MNPQPAPAPGDRRPSGPGLVITTESHLWDALDALLLDPFLRGELPVQHSAHVRRVPTELDVVAPGGRRTHLLRRGSAVNVLAEGVGWRAHYARFGEGDVSLTVVAVDERSAHAVVDALRALALPPDPDPTRLAVTFVRLDSCGAQHTTRRIEVPRWAESAGNYPDAARPHLDALIGRGAPSPNEGRLVLLHGPPGTGKTTFLRALASAWRSWCDTTIVVDPDQLFDKAAYLYQAVMEADEDDDDDGVTRWTLFVLEDCDELLRSDAKRDAGQALSRLLNLADGMLGQGLRVLFCLTTNEPLDRIHPAITRPGRCLANVEIGRFGPDDARRWLAGRRAGPDALAGDGAAGRSLAELYAALTAAPGPAPTPIKGRR